VKTTKKGALPTNKRITQAQVAKAIEKARRARFHANELERAYDRQENKPDTHGLYDKLECAIVKAYRAGLDCDEIELCFVETLTNLRVDDLGKA
jgi:ribosome modulation factor